MLQTGRPSEGQPRVVKTDDAGTHQASFGKRRRLTIRMRCWSRSSKKEQGLTFERAPAMVCLKTANWNNDNVEFRELLGETRTQ